MKANMMNRVLLFAAVALLSMFGPTEVFAQGCVGIATNSQQHSGGQFTESFSATEVLDIDLWVLFTPGSVKRFADDHTVEVKIFTPRGYLYQSIAIPFSSTASKKGKGRKLDGYPHPIATTVLQDVAWKNGKYLGTNVRLPVGGTMITTSSLYGTWSAEAYVDGEPLRCSQPAKFTIIP
ncbi:MAG: hypothetical protein ACYC7A_05660 [Thermoanaerobaculia bacterium]